MASRIGQKRNCVIVSSDGNVGTINAEGRQDFVQHAHPNNVNLHFHVTSTGTLQRFILVDLSNINSFFHANTSYLHLENMDIQIDTSATATYQLTLGFLESVTASGSNLFDMWNLFGNKSTGQNTEAFFPWYPNGFKCRSQSFVSGNVTINDSAYQTGIDLPTVLDVTTADTTPGNGDLILESNVTAGDIAISLNIAYHAH